MARTSPLTWVKVSSWRGASSTAGFGAVTLGRGKEKQGPGRDATGRLGACLGQTSARNA